MTIEASTGRRRRAVLVIGLAAVATLSGCAVTEIGTSGETETPAAQLDGYIDADGVLGEYLETVASFPLDLPPGYDFPDAPPGLTDDVVADGVGAAQAPAYFFWLCAWEDHYLRAFEDGDVEEAERALTQLDEWLSTSFVEEYVEDPENAWYENVLEPAKGGDPSGIRGDVAGCSGFGISPP